jgi:hypothetical protein
MILEDAVFRFLEDSHRNRPRGVLKQMKRELKRIVFAVVVIAAVMVMWSGCGRVKQAAQMAKNVADIAEAGGQMAEDVINGETSEVDWENYDLKENDVRKFYTGVKALQEKYPDVGFEVAMTAAVQAMGEGINLKKTVEKETDMTFDEYSGLSTALMLVQTEAAGLQFTEEMADAMEQGLAQIDELEDSELTEEQMQSIEEQRQSLAEARAEMESPEFQAKKEKAEMVMRIREEAGL